MGSMHAKDSRKEGENKSYISGSFNWIDDMGKLDCKMLRAGIASNYST